MPIPVSDAARDVAEHASSVARLEVELAALELKKKAAALGVGIGLVGGAAVLALYMLGFGLATAAAGLATFLPWWLSLLVVTGFLAVVVTLLAGLGIGRIRRGTPPVPEQAIREAKLTTAAIKS